MRYLGLDVHSATTVWCLLDDSGEVVGKGKLATTAPALKKLLARLGTEDTLLVGQEVGTTSYFVHDVVTSADMKVLSFNAHQLRMMPAPPCLCVRPSALSQ